MKLVTVGIPFYNTETFIENCVQSILNQSYTNLEIILLDDGSRDKSLEKIKKFKDSRIKIISDGENKGLIFRLNQLIDISKGEYFVRMDADDIMFPDRIQKQIETFNVDGSIDLVFGDAISIDDFNQILGYKKSYCINCKSHILNGNTPMHPTVMAKLEWFKKNKYNAVFYYIEDLELWYRTIESSVFKNIKEPLLFYRELGQTNSGKYLKSINSRKAFVKEYNIDFLKSIRFVYFNYLKFLYHFFLESLNMTRSAVSYRSSKMDSSLKFYYQKVINSSIK